MEKSIQELLKEYSKDEQAAQTLQKLIHEITEERDQAREHLRLLEQAIASDYDSILITGLGMDRPGPEIVYVNDGFTRMTGFTKEEAIGQTPRILQGEKTDPAVLKKLRERLQEGKSFFGHTVNYRKDGSEFINQWDIHPLTNEEGEITHWVSYQHDITERKSLEKDFIETGLEFDELTEETKKTLIDLDEQGNIVTANKLFRDLIGYDPEELKSRKFWELMADPFVETYRHKFDQFKPGDFDDRSMEASILTKRGGTIDVKMEARLVQMPEQRLVRITFQNRSLQKRIADLLTRKAKEAIAVAGGAAEAKEFRYKLLPNDDGTFHLEYVSDNYNAVTGLDAPAPGPFDPREWIHEDDYESWKEFLHGVMEGRSLTLQYRLKGAGSAGGTGDAGDAGDDIPAHGSEVIDYAKPEMDETQSRVIAIRGVISKEIASEKRS